MQSDERQWRSPNILNQHGANVGFIRSAAGTAEPVEDLVFFLLDGCTINPKSDRAKNQIGRKDTSSSHCGEAKVSQPRQGPHRRRAPQCSGGIHSPDVETVFQDDAATEKADA